MAIASTATKAGISTLGAKVFYALESTKGTQPNDSAFTQVSRVNSVGSIALTTETIDASALEDLVEKSVAGRGTNGGSYGITINVTSETIAEWTSIISSYKNRSNKELSMWWMLDFPDLGDNAFFCVAEPPSMIPQPSVDQNGLLTVEMTLTINDYKGVLAKKGVSA